MLASTTANTTSLLPRGGSEQVKRAVERLKQNSHPALDRPFVLPD